MTRKRIQVGTDRGLSDVIAFTIVFGIIVTSVGLVSVVGFSTLQEVQQNEQGLNAQRAIQSVADNLGELQSGQTPARTSEIDARDGTIGISSGSTTMNVSVNGSAVFDGPIGTLTYTLPNSDRTVGMQSGAVFNAQNGNSVMVEPPRFVCRTSGTGESTAIVSVMVLHPTRGDQGKSGADVQIRGSYNATSRVNETDFDDGTENVSVEVTGGEFDSAWESGIAASDGSGGWDRPGSSGPAVCSAENVVVRLTVVNVELR